MNDDDDLPPTANAAQMHAIARRLVLPPVIFAALIIVATLGFVLYGKNGAGKEAGASGGADCAASAALAARLAPLAKGDVAALAVKTQPTPMPALAFTLDGKPTDLAAFRGRIALVNFWATWCVPCREEMPALDRLQGASGDKDFVVAAVNVDTARLDRPKAFLQEIGVKNLGFYADATGKTLQTLQQTGLIGLPTTYLVGRDGCQVAVLSGPAKWDGADAKALIQAAAQK